MEQLTQIGQLPKMLQLFCDTIALRKQEIACGLIADNTLDSLTYGQLGENAKAFSAYLQTLTQKGDRVIILAETHNEFVIAFYGCLLAGLVAVPCHVGNPKKSEKLKYIIRDCEAKVVIGLEKTVAKFESVLDENLHFVSVEKSPIHLFYEEPNFKESDIAFLQYTSGTTSDPKGVMVSYNNLFVDLQMIKKSFLFDENMIMVSWLPFYHDMGLVGMVLSPIFSGGTIYYMSPIDFMKKPLRWLSALSDLKATCTGAPNFAFEHSAQRIKEEDVAGLNLSSLQTIFCGAEPIKVESLELFYNKFKPAGLNYNALYPCYGMAEVALFATGGEMDTPMYIQAFNSKDLTINKVTPVSNDSEEAIRLVGCGFPRKDLGATTIIVDPKTKEVITNGIGEIWISGPHVSAGYWKKETVSKETFKARLSEEQYSKTFLRTGDLGFIYNNELFISGRIKNVITIGGKNIHPHDIEASVIESHELIKEGRCAAFSIVNQNTEKLVCVKELHRGIYRTLDTYKANKTQETKKVILEIYRSIQQSISVGNGVNAQDIFFIPQGKLPVTTSGKVKMQECKKQYIEGTLDGFSLMELVKNV